MSNIIIAHFAENSHAAQTEPLFQYDYGQLLKFEGLELPASYEVHFSNSRAGGKAYRLINEGDTVEIPDEMLLDGRTVYVWIFLHTGETDGETEYIVTIPVIDRSEPYDGEPTPHQKSYIDQMVERMEEISAEVNDISAGAVTLGPESDAYADCTDGHITIGVPRGPQGEQGIQGIQGIQGPKGDKGDKGDTGETGATGPQGPIGPRGEPGPRGDAFHIVKTYLSIADMNADYDGTDVDIGEFVMIVSNVEDPDNAKVYVKGDVQYNFVVDMSGSAGIQGPKGDKGDKGDTGETGATGPQGAKGDKGDTGETGAKGDKGDKGDTGETGATGPQGAKGDKGDPGIGIASGGTAGQVLAKASGTDYDTEWVDQSIGNVTDVQINGSSILDAQGVAEIPVASASISGVVRVSSDYGIGVQGGPGGMIRTYSATDEQLKTLQGSYRIVAPSQIHKAAFYGLARAAGDTTQSASSNPVGTYTDNAKSSIRSMLGATSSNVIAVQDTQPTDSDTKIWLPETQETPVQVPTVSEMNAALAEKVSDVQVNGTSVVTDGVANVPVATNQVMGVAKYNSDYGLNASNGSTQIVKATSARVKLGEHQYHPIVPSNQHYAVYYGLAKAAGANMINVTGDTFGIYPEAQKSAISQMLSGPVTVTGSTPTITALPGIEYICGEVSTLDISLPESGCIDVTFDSGATPTVLTIVPPTGQTLRWANGFDPTSLDANTTYEINIENGLGVAASWT